jgi:hypothetical protein
VSKISAQTSSMIFCRAYPDDTIIASRKVSSLGRPVPLSHGFSRSAAIRSSSSSSCSESRPDIRSNRNGFSVSERFGFITSFLLLGEVVPARRTVRVWHYLLTIPGGLLARSSRDY